MFKNNNIINNVRPHDSGKKHVSGFATYIDDILEPNGILYGAIGWSKKAHAIIKKINLEKVIDLMSTEKERLEKEVSLYPWEYK